MNGKNWKLLTLVAGGSIAVGSLLEANTIDKFGSAEATELVIHFGESMDSNPSSKLTLRGSDDRRQMLVTGVNGARNVGDFTRDVSYEVNPSGVVSINESGWVVPLANGDASIVARAESGLTAEFGVTVESFETVAPVNFPNQIVPIFTKNGCNGGGCHGKSGGQNGFRLSLLGFEPTEDYEHLVKESRGRRLFPAVPERSLLLTKGAASVPHGGGQRLDQDSDDYELLVRWISQGMPYGRPDDPVVDRIEVFPKQRIMPLNGKQQLRVVAHYTDGSQVDVSRSALFEANQTEMAEVDESGHVTLFEQPGDVAIMIRYQAKVAVFRATIPLGAPVDQLPSPRNFVDELVFSKLKAVGMPPSELSDDSTFLRRTAVDIAGRMPTLEETEKFLANDDPGKRDAWIDYLLDDPGYGAYFANKWSALLRNKRTRADHKNATFGFYNWLRYSIQQNKPYDQFVRDVVAASGEVSDHPPVAWYREVRDLNVQVEDTAQLFLGMRLQCAQCHHHPFEKWSQQDYYSLAAFFGQVGRKKGQQPGGEMIYHKRGTAKAVNKKTNKPVPPAGLGAVPVRLSADEDPRHALVDWMADSKNPFFARALVNRYWKHFFGRGLVDPEDDMRETNPPTNPELLDALGQSFVESGYDMKALIRTICQSQTYQRSAIPNEYNQIDKQNFSRYYPKRLTAEVLYDSVLEVLGAQTKFEGLPGGTRAIELPDNSYNNQNYFLTVFGRPDSASSCECERSQDASLAQSLHLLNSKDIQEKLAADGGRAAQLALDQEITDEAKVTKLYLSVFSRPPTSDELSIAIAHLQKPPRPRNVKDGNNVEVDATTAKREAYEDILWALVNTKEFLFNH